MSSINFATKEISVKVVFYGPGLCGKTTTLQAVYNSIRPDRRPQMVSLATDVDRTIFFDFLPVNAYKIGDFIVRLQLYTVPGQVFYNSTRKLVLNGVDGVVFVADSQPAALEDDKESLQNLRDNLEELGMSLRRVPYVLQYNKRDIPDCLSIEQMNAELNTDGVPFFASSALGGEGVQDVLRGISRLVIADLNAKGVGRKVMQQKEDERQPSSAPLAAGTGTFSSISRSDAHASPAPTSTLTGAHAALQRSASASAHAHANTAPPPPQAAPAPAPSVSKASEAPTSLAEAMQQRAESFAMLSFAALWPSSELRDLCRACEANFVRGDYRQVVLGTQRMAAAFTSATRGEELALEMVLRGVRPDQIVRFRSLIQKAAAGESITMTDGLHALHIVLQLVS